MAGGVGIDAKRSNGRKEGMERSFHLFRAGALIFERFSLVAFGTEKRGGRLLIGAEVACEQMFFLMESERKITAGAFENVAAGEAEKRSVVAALGLKRGWSVLLF